MKICYISQTRGVGGWIPDSTKIMIPARASKPEMLVEEKEKLSLECVALQGVVEQLRRTQVGLDGILEKTVSHGVGFHHAGLTFDERERC